VTKAGEFGRNIMTSLKNAILSIKLPIPTIEFAWGEWMGIKYPKIEFGVSWKRIGDLIGANEGNALQGAGGGGGAGAGSGSYGGYGGGGAGGSSDVLEYIARLLAQIVELLGGTPVLRDIDPVVKKLKKDIDPVVKRLREDIDPVVKKLRKGVDPVVKRLREEDRRRLRGGMREEFINPPVLRQINEINPPALEPVDVLDGNGRMSQTTINNYWTINPSYREAESEGDLFHTIRALQMAVM